MIYDSIQRDQICHEDKFDLIYRLFAQHLFEEWHYHY